MATDHWAGTERVERVIQGVWGAVRDLDFVVDRSDSRRIAFSSDASFPILNLVTAVRLDDVPADVDAIAEEYRERGRSWMWWVSPSFDAPGLEGVLESHGMNPDPVLGMHRVLDGSPARADLTNPRNLTIEEALPGERRFIDTLRKSFGLPVEVGEILSQVHRATLPDSSIHLVAAVDGEPIGTASGFIVDDIVEIHNLSATSDDHREAVMRSLVGELLQRGRRHGCRYTTGLTHPSDRSVYLQAGFGRACATTQWIWSPPSGR